MKELVVVLSEKDRESLGGVRCFPGLEAAAEGGMIWLRGINASGELNINIRKLPSLRTYLLDEHGMLFPLGSITPESKLKHMTWAPLAEFITPEAPISAMPGRTKEKYRVRLVASGRAEKGEVLLTSLAHLKSYAEAAPGVRLAALRFAASSEGEVLIAGTPLPPLPGREYWMRDNILLPAGYDFEMPVVYALINENENALRDSFLLFDTNGEWQKIAVRDFVTATRSAIRQTGEWHSSQQQRNPGGQNE